MPNLLWAKSINHITKVVTVGQGEVLGIEENEVNAPTLNIELNDGLSKGDRFYINLQDAIWTKDEMTLLKVDETEEQPDVLVIGKQISPIELEVQVVEGNLEKGKVLEIPLYVKVAGKEAKLHIDSNNTTVTEEMLTFANIASGKAKVIPIEKIQKVTEKGMMPKINIEENYVGQIRSSLEQGKQNTILLRLEHTDFMFELMDSSKLVGSKGFEGINVGKENLKLLSDGQLQITLPDTIKEVPKSSKGAFTLEGVLVKAKDHQPRIQEVTVKVTGDLVEETSFKVLELGEYKVTLKVENEAYILSGQLKQVNFTLLQDMQDSLLKERAMFITVSSGVEVLQKDGKVDVMVEGMSLQYDALIENGKCIGFKINALNEESLRNKQNLNFKFNVKIPTEFSGNVTVHLEGSALPNEIDEKLFSVAQPVNVKVEAVEVKSGVKDQMGGSLTIKENKQGALKQNASLFIGIDTSMIHLSKAPLVAVIEGDIVVGEPKIIDGGVELPIIAESSIPSTIVIKHFGLTLDGTVPQGRFEVAVGGPALSSLSEQTISKNNHFESIAPIINEDFVLVDIGPKNRKVITFKLGEEAYAVNGRYYHLEVPAYIENGRVMVPIKYVAEALGIGQGNVKYDAKTQVLTVYANKVIELEINSDTMYVDGEKVVMQTSAKLKQGYTMVPIGEVARALDLKVEWNSKLETATFVGYYE